MSATIELCLALVALAAFAGFVMDAEALTAIALEWHGAHERKIFAAQKCGATIGMIYSQAGGELDERVDCRPTDGKHGADGRDWAPFLSAALRTGTSGSILLKVENHYGKGPALQP